MCRRCSAGNRPKNEENATRNGDVSSGDYGYGEGRGWPQNLGLSKGKPSPTFWS